MDGKIAMIRQHGKPTIFVTMRAKEIRFPKLLNLWHGVSDSTFISLLPRTD
jgi:hypothetical protein